MKLYTTLNVTLVAITVITMLSASAAPMLARSLPIIPEQNENVAVWWKNYMLLHSKKDPPIPDQIDGLNDEDLGFHFKPFSRRVAQLDHLKTWALANPETHRALTGGQREVLKRPFFGWDSQALKSDKLDSVSLHSRLGVEKTFVADVESILYDLAKHLPDLSPRP
ncbi:hypothetical protein NDA11_006541 [Ustilago hordei]|uniref:Uncharacterized protein n=1 Tax=Ustilago hordei TaxID=120017 RepID=I2FPN4_USTHO|nr:uncharacterized protein UHO2_04656 [Ustilago hordei]KAJ1041687.1 hypothetical protein NDA10_004234 [Ustilago hordei]KAJ1575400.1 hypothetical protein NDA15_001421 [Ustilago hordei]KAJ1577369.1 hypothetical protein NDA12_007185 [Ustilago hordei]KAJ1595244.1 hypothetical protein NDA11_006541 [Ustilago hordei]KAJ1596922.1 hypothetical protein NDA14_000656 [Ustilago hordei]